MPQWLTITEEYDGQRRGIALHGAIVKKNGKKSALEQNLGVKTVRQLLSAGALT